MAMTASSKMSPSGSTSVHWQGLPMKIWWLAAAFPRGPLHTRRRSQDEMRSKWYGGPALQPPKASPILQCGLGMKQLILWSCDAVWTGHEAPRALIFDAVWTGHEAARTIWSPSHDNRCYDKLVDSQSRLGLFARCSSGCRCSLRMNISLNSFSCFCLDLLEGIPITD